LIREREASPTARIAAARDGTAPARPVRGSDSDGEARMGVYLSTPKTDKVSADGENDRVRFGLSSMQGWRANMEDAVSCV